MAQQHVEDARRVYELMNEAYRTGDPEIIRPHLQARCDPEVLLEPAGVLPETQTAHGYDGVVDFMALQMKVFADGSMWIEPTQFIDEGDHVVAPHRFGGRARETGID